MEAAGSMCETVPLDGSKESLEGDSAGEARTFSCRASMEKRRNRDSGAVCRRRVEGDRSLLLSPSNGFI